MHAIGVTARTKGGKDTSRPVFEEMGYVTRNLSDYLRKAFEKERRGPVTQDEYRAAMTNLVKEWRDQEGPGVLAKRALADVDKEVKKHGDGLKFAFTGIRHPAEFLLFAERFGELFFPMGIYAAKARRKEWYITEGLKKRFDHAPTEAEKAAMLKRLEAEFERTEQIENNALPEYGQDLPGCWRLVPNDLKIYNTQDIPYLLDRVREKAIYIEEKAALLEGQRLTAEGQPSVPEKSYHPGRSKEA